MPGIEIEDQLGVRGLLEDDIRLVVLLHAIVGSICHQHRQTKLAEPTANTVFEERAY